MKSLILILICLLLITPSKAAEQQIVQTEQIEQRIKIQEQRLTNIKEQVSMKQKQIEDWYFRRLTELRQLAQRKAKQLKLDDRALWTEFVKMNEQTPQFDTYFKISTTIFTRDAKSYELHAAMLDSYFLSSTADLLLNNDFRNMLIYLANGSSYNPEDFLIRKQARKLLQFANEFDIRLQILNKQRDIKLAAVEQGEKDLRADIFRVMNEIKTESEKIDTGMVSAVIYNDNTQLCMIDGYDRILKTGDKINNITIQNIYSDRVEFIKDGQRWTQEVGKPANDAWR